MFLIFASDSTVTFEISKFHKRENHSSSLYENGLHGDSRFRSAPIDSNFDALSGLAASSSVDIYHSMEDEIVVAGLSQTGNGLFTKPDVAVTASELLNASIVICV